jgi:cell division protein FtsN
MSTFSNGFGRRQAGGTLIGFISGLVIGLGIAVVVAVMITKTPVPFLNARIGDKVKTPDYAASANASAIGDPNKPLFGKQDAAREAAREFTKEAPADNAGAAPAAPTAAAAPAGDKTQAKAPDAAASKNAPAIVPAKVDAKDTPAAAAEDKYVYYLQAGAFREQGDAEGAKAKLALQGFEASISEKAGDNGAPGGTLYRVRLGPYGQIDAMNRVRSKLAESGVDVAVVRMAK